MKPSNATVLKVAAALNALITAVQLVFALSIGSLSLLADGLQMAIDTVTYIVSLWAERRRLDARQGKIFELGAVVFSVVALLGVSVYVFFESISVIQSGTADTDVNMHVVMVFALIGLLFDAVEIGLFVTNHRQQQSASSGDSLSSDSLGSSLLTDDGTAHASRKHSDGKLNMCAAFLHVGGDTLRSSSTLITSLVVLGGDADSGKADAYCAVFIAATLVVAGLCMVPGIRSLHQEVSASRNGNGSGPADGPDRPYSLELEMGQLESGRGSEVTV